MKEVLMSIVQIILIVYAFIKLEQITNLLENIKRTNHQIMWSLRNIDKTESEVYTETNGDTSITGTRQKE